MVARRRRIQPPQAMAVALACIVLVQTATVAMSQAPFVPPEFLNERRRIGGDTIRMCVWVGAPTEHFDAEVAREIAGLLLIEPTIVPFEITIPLDDGGEFWEEVYTALHNDCDAFLGVDLLPSIQLPDWLTISRPYFEAPFVVAVNDNAARSLADVPAGATLGSKLFTRADLALLAHQRAVDPEERWRRLPFDNTTRLVDYLLDGQVDAGLVWEAALAGELAERGLESGGEAGINVVPMSPPLPLVERSVGVLMLAQDSLLRSVIDQGIQELQAEGALAALSTEFALRLTD